MHKQKFSKVTGGFPFLRASSMRHHHHRERQTCPPPLPPPYIYTHSSQAGAFSSWHDMARLLRRHPFFFSVFLSLCPGSTWGWVVSPRTPFIPHRVDRTSSALRTTRSSRMSLEVEQKFQIRRDAVRDLESQLERWGFHPSVPSPLSIGILTSRTMCPCLETTPGCGTGRHPGRWANGNSRLEEDMVLAPPPPLSMKKSKVIKHVCMLYLV
jgi:hypothetical protein